MGWFLPVLSIVIGPVVGYLVYRWKLSAELEISAARHALEKEDAPVKILTAALESKDRELGEFRSQLNTFLTNHMEHDRQEREAQTAERQNVVEILATMQAEQKVVAESLSAVHEGLKLESSSRQQLAERVAKMEGKVGA